MTPQFQERDEDKPMEEIDNETAAQLFHHGAIFIMLEVPPGTQIGIDYNSWQTGDKFKGIKMIPPGIHYIFYSSSDKSGNNSPRSGFFHDFKKREVFIKIWDPANEDIKSEPIEPDLQIRIENNREQMDGFLGPYPYQRYRKWVSLSDKITTDIVARLTPDCGQINAVTQIESETSNTEQRRANRDRELDEFGLHPRPAVVGSVVKYTPVSEFHRLPVDATPSEITRYSLDTSFLLEQYMNSHPGVTSILGEMQFSFLIFLLGHVYDGFEQWKQLFSMICRVDEAIPKYVELFSSFVNVLYHTMEEVPTDFFVDTISKTNFISSELRILFSNIENVQDKCLESLQKKMSKFQKHMEKKYNWDFTLEPDHELPIIVKL